MARRMFLLMMVIIAFVLSITYIVPSSKIGRAKTINDEFDNIMKEIESNIEITVEKNNADN